MEKSIVENNKGHLLGWELLVVGVKLNVGKLTD
jgi:hypothetical protein